MKPKQLFFFIAGSLLTALTAEGFANVHLPGRLLVVLNGTSYQENYPVPELIYFVPEYSLTLLEDMLTAFNASRIDSEPDGNGTFRCYLLNSDEFYSSREQERFLCISPELQLDKTNQQVISRSEEMQGEWQWYNALAFVGSGVANLFVQQLNSLLAGFWKSLFHYDTDSEETGTNNTVVVLPEPPSSPSSNRALSGSSYPFEPPPPPFMPGIPAKGLFDMPGWEFDYLLSLALINQRLKQWIHGWYHTTARKSGQPVSAFDLSMVLEGVKQEGAINKSLFRHLPSDASELLAQLTGKDLPGYHPPHQTETVILYPVFVLPQSASNRLEETKDAEFVGTACSICLEAFKESDKVVKTPCLHLYHIGCLNHWMTTEIEGQNMSTCPSCRGEIEVLRVFLNLESQIVTQERLRHIETAGLKEVQTLVSQMQSGAGVWPDDDRDVYAQLRRAQQSSDPGIAGQAQEIYPKVYFYSVLHLVSQMQSGTGVWPDDESTLRARLRGAEKSSDPRIAEQAKEMEPSVNFYSVQYLVSQMQSGTGVWPDDESTLRARLKSAQRNTNPHTNREAQKIESLVNFYSRKHGVSQMQSGTSVRPDGDFSVRVQLSSTQRSSNPHLGQQAQEFETRVDFHVVLNLLPQRQSGTDVRPDDDSSVRVRLNSAQKSSQSKIFPIGWILFWLVIRTQQVGVW